MLAARSPTAPVKLLYSVAVYMYCGIMSRACFLCGCILQEGHASITALLLSLGADIFLPNKNGRSGSYRCILISV